MSLKVKTFILDVLIILICLIIARSIITFFTGIEEGFVLSIISIAVVILFRPRVDVLTDPINKKEIVLFKWSAGKYSKRLDIF